MTDAIGYETGVEAISSISKEPARTEGSNDKGTMDFASALNTWRDIELPTLQANVGAICPSLIEAQKDALLSRKKLAEQTREFKKLSVESQPEQIKPLLKAYQAEIDSLTKRAKAAENAVLGVQDRLQGACDPYPLLELLVEQTVAVADAEALRAQVDTLRSRNTSMEQQLSALPALEADKKRLTERITTLEASSERRLAEARTAIESELSAKWDERLRNQSAREESLTKSLELTQSQLQELRANYAKATERLLSHGEEFEREEANGKIEELDVISEELARSNERAASMERRNEQLRQEIERLKSHAGEDERTIEAERRAFEAHEETLRLAKLLDEASEKSQGEMRECEKKFAICEAQLREKTEESQSLRGRLQRMSDYDEVKRELEIFKYVEFAVDADRRFGDEDDSENGEKGRNGAQSDSSTAAKPLEALLIEKNRSMQDELTSLRVKHQDLAASFDITSSELNDARKATVQLQELNARLEDDLVNLKPSPGYRGNAKTGATMSAEEALAEMDKIAGEPTPSSAANGAKSVASTAAGIGPNSQSKAAGPSIASGVSTPVSQQQGGAASSASILPIITSQRDRFRARNAELEEELRKQFATITELRTEVKTLQSDNLGLYEKVRYLQAYHGGAVQTGSGSSSGLRGGQVAGTRIVNMAAARNDAGASSYPPSSLRAAEDKYRDKYEASMNPFEQFRGHEQSRALHALNPLERLLHMLTRVVLGHRRMRIFFVVYAVSLHLLVFAMLFEVEFGYSGYGSG